MNEPITFVALTNCNSMGRQILVRYDSILTMEVFRHTLDSQHCTSTELRLAGRDDIVSVVESPRDILLLARLRAPEPEESYANHE